MDQFLTYKKAKIGPVFNFTAHIYIYNAIYAFRPICCLLFIANTTHFANFGGKRRRFKDNQKIACLARFGVHFFWAIFD